MVVGTFLVLMIACVVGLVTWKASYAREAALKQSRDNQENLTRSLAQHAASTFKAPDVALVGMADLLKYQAPQEGRFNAYLRQMTQAMPQLRFVAVFDSGGDWRYSSLEERPAYSNADRPYFAYHRDNSSTNMLISGPVTSRLTGLPTIILSRRISAPTGQFAGVIVAAIDCQFFSSFFSSFNVGSQGGISILKSDGTLLTRWPVAESLRTIGDTSLFQQRMGESTSGFYRITSPFDGLIKYIGYEQTPNYPLVVTVARSEAEVLDGWRTDLVSDALIAGLLLAVVLAIACLLNAQFRFGARVERSLQEREARFRLLADNIADIVIVMDKKGCVRYVSPSVVTVLDTSEDAFLGRSCLDVVHEDDRDGVINASKQLKDAAASPSVRFRMRREDGSIVWLEAHFKVAERFSSADAEIVGVLRDVTKQKEMEDELSKANLKLAQLAMTDGLTNLANRRSFDAFLRDAYAAHDVLSVLLIDIDHFKEFNDSLGHPAGDACLQQVAEVIGRATANTGGFAARYGGEEFAVVLPAVTEEKAARVSDAIRLLVQRLKIRHPRSPTSRVAVSVGVAQKTLATSDEFQLIREADIALYHAKKRGRNCTVVGSTIASWAADAPGLAPSLASLQRTQSDTEQARSTASPIRPSLHRQHHGD
ncbi:diguanylate cyclase domain-containing protein [Bradyrhizobium centrosematis]|uniref:diguanylate cyclase domain-containing protein n=1 Tax=Bradyrhizobium centrosematis TaxID=1300039 RepID=UPI00216718A9|nr:diguanylate cyclase [Bradyrhizobium centrosematis]MCS3763131.1 diguanylate cyclase (GGDEF)-like protein/PAS domain S-box-containing protein [Bradyrhizobium centrosematis]MCS3775798.1 diguanylate cyclase (GGDEF)-like protein/PAS domain S-box-containing protein [Bradyrhizobium centrosematis]